MGSSTISPRLPIHPQSARTIGASPSLLSSWPTASCGQAHGRVRFPTSLTRIALPMLIYALLPRRAAGAPGPAMLIGALMNSSIGTTPGTTSAWTFAFLSAAALAAFVISKHFNFGAVGVFR